MHSKESTAHSTAYIETWYKILSNHFVQRELISKHLDRITDSVDADQTALGSSLICVYTVYQPLSQDITFDNVWGPFDDALQCMDIDQKERFTALWLRITVL